MTILDRYLIQRLTSTFLKTCVSLIMLFIMIDAMTHRRSTIMEQDVPASVVLEYYIALIPMMLNSYQLAPLSLLISGLLTFGTFAQRSEYTATLAGGIGLKRIMLAPAIVALTTTAGMFFLNEVIGPEASRKTKSIESHYFGKIRHDASAMRVGVFWPNLEGGWKCDIRSFNREALTGESVFLYSLEGTRHEQIEARRIFWDETQSAWMLEQGTWTIYKPSQGMIGIPTRITQIKAPFTDTPEYLFTSEVDTQTQSIAQLCPLIKKHQNQRRTARRMTLDLHRKIVDPLLCPLFMALALPFSIRLGRGGVSVGLSIAIFIGLGYLILSAITQSMGYTDQISPISAAWFPFTVYFFATYILILRTPT